MSDYTKTVDFAAKDTLPSGDPNKVAKGTEVDTEYDNIAIAIATKFDANDRGSANGIASLDALALVPSAELPTANTTTVGALETATSAEAIALSATNKIIVPSVLSAGIGAWGDLNGGMVSDIQALADPGVDTLVGRNDTAGAAISFTLGNGIQSTGSVLSVTQGDISLVNLSDYDANDHIDHTTVTLTAGTGLTGGGTIAGNRTFNVDISALTNMDISETAATDSVLVNDGGVMKQMDIQDMGLRVVEETAAQTFALGDANTLQLLTGVTTRVWDIPTNAAVAYPIGAIIYVGARDTAALTISPNTSAVTLTSILRSDVGPTAGDHTVAAGGIAALVKVATNEWMITGDIT
jgi:hypothetical protein